jgi:hypothetical protein
MNYKMGLFSALLNKIGKLHFIASNGPLYHIIYYQYWINKN